MESQYEKIIEDVQDQCEFFARNIITRLCKRAIHKMNSWNVKIGTDDYPASFNFFDVLSIEFQSKTYDEISPFLEDEIDGALACEYENLSPQERFFIDYSRCYYDNGYDPLSIEQLIHNRFNELLNEHWGTKKISNFENSRS